jgi:diaminopimelate epimerase
MKIKFSKYQGTGNDFIMLDNLSGEYDSLTIPQIQFLCNRKFGIGADGLIKISKAENLAFEIDYYNSDGTKSFCGNGARCSVAFAQTLGINSNHVVFTAIDGLHEAQKKEEMVSLKMNNVLEIREKGEDFELFTGSPHYVRFVENSLDINVFQEGRKVRYSPEYQEEGINVNFVETLNSKELLVTTYERGVENETLSCGTGVTAAALAYAQKNELFGKHEILIHTKGGKLKVVFNRISDDEYFDVYLIGPAVRVFSGEIDI